MNDIYTRITERIITLLEAGTPPWVKPWSGAADPIPANALTARPYRGINTLVLGIETQLQGYASNRWLTFRQAKELGATVRRGEHGCQIIYYALRVVEKDETEPILDPDENVKCLPLLKVFTVFNVSQIDSLPAHLQVKTEADPTWSACGVAEEILTDSGAEIHHSGYQAYYSPSQDQIHLPPRAVFATSEKFYGTALHELAHWTGHPDRLTRQLGRRFGSAAYAMEELVAELGASFLCAHCRLDNELQHASYVANWLEVLKRDERAIFVAAAQAQKAADYLLVKAGRMTPAEPTPLPLAA